MAKILSEKQQKYAKKIIGILFVPLLITFLIQPVVYSVIIDWTAEAGITNHPEVKTDVNYRVPEYKENQTVDKWGKTVWENGFGLFTVSVSNTGSASAKQVKLRLHLPGCSEEVFIPKVDSVQVGNIASPEVTGGGKKAFTNATFCSKKIQIENLSPTETVSVTILVDEKVLSENTTYVDLAATPKYPVRYFWTAHGGIVREKRVERATAVTEAYQRLNRRTKQNMSSYVYIGAVDKKPEIPFGCFYIPESEFEQDLKGMTLKGRSSDRLETPVCPAT